MAIRGALLICNILSIPKILSLLRVNNIEMPRGRKKQTTTNADVPVTPKVTRKNKSKVKTSVKEKEIKDRSEVTIEQILLEPHNYIGQQVIVKGRRAMKEHKAVILNKNGAWIFCNKDLVDTDEDGDVEGVVEWVIDSGTAFIYLK